MEGLVAEEDVLVKGVELDKKTVAEKDVTEAVLLVDDSKKRRQLLWIISVSWWKLLMTN